MMPSNDIGFHERGNYADPIRMEDEPSLAETLYPDRPAIGDYTKSAEMQTIPWFDDEMIDQGPLRARTIIVLSRGNRSLHGLSRPYRHSGPFFCMPFSLAGQKLERSGARSSRCPAPHSLDAGSLRHDFSLIHPFSKPPIDSSVGNSPLSSNRTLFHTPYPAHCDLSFSIENR